MTLHLLGLAAASTQLMGLRVRAIRIDLGAAQTTGLRVLRDPDYFFAAPALARLAPYFERACLRSLTPWVSSAPRTMW